MRKVSEVTNISFPFNDPVCCTLYIGNDGKAHQVYKSKELEYYNEVKNGNGSLIIVWPGKTRSDAFFVDDIEQYGQTKGFSVQETEIDETNVQENNETNTVVDDLDNFI